MGCGVAVGTTSWLIMWDDSLFLKRNWLFIKRTSSANTSSFSLCLQSALLCLVQKHCSYDLGGFQWAVIDRFLQTLSSSKEGRKGHYIQSLTHVLVSFLKGGDYSSQSTVVFSFVFVTRASEALWRGLCSPRTWPALWPCTTRRASALSWMLEDILMLHSCPQMG